MGILKVNTKWREHYDVLKKSLPWWVRAWHLIRPPGVIDVKTNRAYHKYFPDGIYILLNNEEDGDG